MKPTRRALGGMAMGAMAMAGAQKIPIIDTHFHLYDQSRPQGAPYPFTPNQPPFLARHYRATAAPLGIVGGIKVEASPWMEDNLWVLMQIEEEPMIVGMVGNLDPTREYFGELLERYHRNKLFLGIRYGNVWPGQDLVKAVDKPECIANLKLLAQAGLVLEVANPRLDLIEATLKVKDKVPELRVVLGHLQAMALPGDARVLEGYRKTLVELRQRGAFVKLSGLHKPRNLGDVPFDAAVYKPVMDFIVDIYGEDHLVYAGRSKAALDILMAYFEKKGPGWAEKFFWKNSVKAFRWVKREAAQPQLG